MSHQQNPTNQQNHDQGGNPLDAILLSGFNSTEHLQPSSGFVLAVMDAVHEQAAVPAPIPFPWKRILPGGIVIPCLLAAFLIWAAHHSVLASDGDLPLAAFTPVDATLCWIALAFALTLVAVSTSFRLANRR